MEGLPVSVFWTDARLTYPTLDFLTSFDPQPENGVWWHEVPLRAYLTRVGGHPDDSSCMMFPKIFPCVD